MFFEAAQTLAWLCSHSTLQPSWLACAFPLVLQQVHGTSDPHPDSMKHHVNSLLEAFMTAANVLLMACGQGVQLIAREPVHASTGYQEQLWATEEDKPTVPTAESSERPRPASHRRGFVVVTVTPAGRGQEGVFASIIASVCLLRLQRSCPSSFYWFKTGVVTGNWQ